MIVRFEPHGELTKEIRARVAAYLAEQEPGRVRRRMLTKTALILTWAVGSYAGLLFAATRGWHVVVLSTSLGLAMAGVGFCIQHDANHGSYPVGRRFRRVLGFCLDLLGGSSYLWKFQHNINHHSFTNVADADNDINVGMIARLSPHQPRRGYHRFQHIYVWPLYAFLGLSWLLWADWRDYFSSSIGSNRFARPRGTERTLFWLGKGAWVVIWLVIPLALHPVGYVLGALLWAYLVLGFTMAVVFQLAHVVQEADFPDLKGAPARAPCDFFTHQLATTVNFAPGNRVFEWYLGGLNYQVEHHLFPTVCHLHYPAIAPIVRAACRERGVRYNSLPTFRAAFASHVDWLFRMGRPSAAAVSSPMRSEV